MSLFNRKYQYELTIWFFCEATRGRKKQRNNDLKFSLSTALLFQQINQRLLGFEVWTRQKRTREVRAQQRVTMREIQEAILFFYFFRIEV